MDIVKKVDKLRLERGWSINRLASEAMITQSTLANMFNSGAEPKISTLKSLCDAFEISLSEFFYENDGSEINPKTLEMIALYENLSETQKKAVFEIIKVMAK